MRNKLHSIVALTGRLVKLDANATQPLVYLPNFEAVVGHVLVKGRHDVAIEISGGGND